MSSGPLVARLGAPANVLSVKAGGATGRAAAVAAVASTVQMEIRSVLLIMDRHANRQEVSKM